MLGLQVAHYILNEHIRKRLGIAVHKAVSRILNASKMAADAFRTNGDQIIQIFHAEKNLVKLLHVRGNAIVPAQQVRLYTVGQGTQTQSDEAIHTALEVSPEEKHNGRTFGHSASKPALLF
ncbi:Uncharacterised protein [Burkholderia pseudomallei]|nr:Uncharacterised protein [Burkholderia pseudomallei]CAJ3910655.1 Uncharacterised protein [Burkholderia pseudomallei]